MKTVHDNKKQTVRHVCVILAISMPFIIGTLLIMEVYTERLYSQAFKSPILIEHAKSEKDYIESVLSKSDQISSFKYELVVKTPLSENDITEEFWQKGEVFRTAAGKGNLRNAIIIDREEMAMYVYMLSKPKIVTKINLNEESNQYSIDVDEQMGMSIKFRSEELLKSNPSLIGTEKIEGKECIVMEYHKDGKVGKMWVWKDYGLPIKIEPGENSKTISYLKAENIEFIELNDDFFKVPEDSNIIELPLPIY